MTHPGLAAPAPDVPPPFDRKAAYDWAEAMVNREGGQLSRFRWALVEAYMAGREAMRRETIHKGESE